MKLTNIVIYLLASLCLMSCKKEYPRQTADNDRGELQESQRGEEAEGEFPSVSEVRSDRNRNSYEWQWRSPINFWGKVVDQFDNPVPNASVTFSWTDSSPAGSSEAIVESDENGLVALTGQKGKALAVFAEKKGYAGTDQSHTGVEYAEKLDPRYRQMDPAKPHILRLRKKDPPSELVHRQNLKLVDRSGGELLAYDLLGQRQVDPASPTADIAVQMWPGRQRRPEEGKPFPWKVVISAPHGGIQLARQDDVIAPTDGYVRQLEFFGKPEDPEWRDDVVEWVFIRSRSNQVHARVHLRASPAPRFDPAAANLREYFANPTGALGLEYSRDLDVSERYYIPR